ncbi:DUF4271 domain-containing protein [Postechiella marina]|uniref:DUF4271 domain-containing protein n=1 Tax=Postechiella marina TaxID=943941 RepID=A0ABP8C3G4_9FLAO
MLRQVTSNELITILMVIGLTVISVAKLVAPKRFNDFIFVLGSIKYLKIYSRDQKFFDNFDALLFINLILSSAIFGVICLQYNYQHYALDINTMFKLTVGVGVFILIKVLLERLIGSLFEIDKLMDAYLFQKITYKNYLGLILIPINGLLVYAFPKALTIIYVMIALLLLINLIGLLTSFKTHQNTIKNNLFYFILYLCALEIAPYIILYKVFIE